MKFTLCSSSSSEEGEIKKEKKALVGTNQSTKKYNFRKPINSTKQKKSTESNETKYKIDADSLQSDKETEEIKMLQKAREHDNTKKQTKRAHKHYNIKNHLTNECMIKDIKFDKQNSSGINEYIKDIQVEPIDESESMISDKELFEEIKDYRIKSSPENSLEKIVFDINDQKEFVKNLLKESRNSLYKEDSTNLKEHDIKYIEENNLNGTISIENDTTKNILTNNVDLMRSKNEIDLKKEMCTRNQKQENHMNLKICNEQNKLDYINDQIVIIKHDNEFVEGSKFTENNLNTKTFQDRLKYNKTYENNEINKNENDKNVINGNKNEFINNKFKNDKTSINELNNNTRINNHDVINDTLISDQQFSVNSVYNNHMISNNKNDKIKNICNKNNNETNNKIKKNPLEISFMNSLYYKGIFIGNNEIQTLDDVINIENGNEKYYIKQIQKNKPFKNVKIFFEQFFNLYVAKFLKNLKTTENKSPIVNKTNEMNKPNILHVKDNQIIKTTTFPIFYITEHNHKEMSNLVYQKHLKIYDSVISNIRKEMITKNKNIIFITDRILNKFLQNDYHTFVEVIEKEEKSFIFKETFKTEYGYKESKQVYLDYILSFHLSEEYQIYTVNDFILIVYSTSILHKDNKEFRLYNSLKAHSNIEYIFEKEYINFIENNTDVKNDIIYTFFDEELQFLNCLDMNQGNYYIHNKEVRVISDCNFFKYSGLIINNLNE
ncbi:hypothetical protein COBT_003026 [Conglomerata obtusa]